MSEGEDHEDGRSLREAADAAAAHYEQRRTTSHRDEPVVGTPGWLGRSRGDWDDVRFLDVVEEEYGRVVRLVVVLVREVVLLTVLFWCVAFVMGFTVDGENVGVLGAVTSVATAALLVAVLLRVLLGLVAVAVRRTRAARRRSST